MEPLREYPPPYFTNNTGYPGQINNQTGYYANVTGAQQYTPNGPTVITVNTEPNPPQPQVVIIGGCPACRVGVLQNSFTCMGICLAILFFPLGLVFLFCLMEDRCTSCGAVYAK